MDSTLLVSVKGCMDVPVSYVECHGIDPDRRRHPLPSWRETVQKFFSGRSNTSRATARSIGVVALLLACPPLIILGYRHIFGPSRYIEWMQLGARTSLRLPRFLLGNQGRRTPEGSPFETRKRHYVARIFPWNTLMSRMSRYIRIVPAECTTRAPLTPRSYRAIHPSLTDTRTANTGQRRANPWLVTAHYVLLH